MNFTPNQAGYRITAPDRVIDENGVTGRVLAVVHDIAVIKPDYANGQDGFEYTTHVSRLNRLEDDGET